MCVGGGGGGGGMGCIRVQGFPRLPFGQFYSQNLVPDLLKLGAWVLSDAYMINPKLYLYIYGFIF